jgi:hypothetical protein
VYFSETILKGERGKYEEGGYTKRFRQIGDSHKTKLLQSNKVLRENNISARPPTMAAFINKKTHTITGWVLQKLPRKIYYFVNTQGAFECDPFAC